MEMALGGKIAVVTGAARGIGAQVASSLAREEAHLVLADIDAEGLARTAEQLTCAGAKCCEQVVDISRTESIRRLMDRAREEFGGLDILVNCAGIVSLAEVEEVSEFEWDRMLAVNLKGTFFCCQIALKQMKEKGWGRIVSMASIAGKDGGVVAPHYGVSKAGIICLTKCFARYGAAYGITANCISPGPVETEMTRAWPAKTRQQRLAQTPLGRFAQPEDIAEMAVFLVSPLARHITGENIDINGGILMD